MPKVYERTATADLYKNGKKTPAKNKQGFTLNRKQPSDDKDKVIVKKGEKYFTWHPKGCDWQISKTKPDVRLQWDKDYEDWESRVDDACDDNDRDEMENLRVEIEERRDEMQ